ncbi:MAG: monovalent cation/H(+) antiporter subunit G [Verrucomicrobiia bacterium]|jgi:multicomponent Na+:H+ antiporter subunit G
MFANLGVAIDCISIFLIAVGILFFLGSVIGLMRFPDFYTRMHAAGKGDTLSTILILGGLAVHYLHQLHGIEPGHVVENIQVFLVAGKIFAIAAFIMLTSPTSTHALMQAGYHDGIKPVGEDVSEDSEPEGNV